MLDAARREAGFLAQFGFRQLDWIADRLVPSALRKLPAASADRVTVLFDQMDQAVLNGGDHGEVGFFNDAVDSQAAILAANLIFANGHPTVLVDHFRANGFDLKFGHVMDFEWLALGVGCSEVELGDSREEETFFMGFEAAPLDQQLKGGASESETSVEKSTTSFRWSKKVWISFLELSDTFRSILR